MRIPFPVGLDGSEDLPRTKRTLLNCFNNGQNQIIGRPGIPEIVDMAAVARGNFEWNGSLYAVYSQELRKITNVTTGAYSVIGPIAGSEPIETDVGFNDAVIVVRNGALYTLSTSDVLTDISGNANFVACVDVAHINGRFVYIPASGDPAFFSDVGAAGTVQALSFFDAEELPDKNNAVFNFNNTLYIGGTDSIQPFRDVATTAANPFLPIPNARILNGYIGGLMEYNNTFLFIGREKDQDYGIYSLAQGQAPKISSAAIDLILSTYTIENLSMATTQRFKWRGYDIASFKLDSDSFAFFGGNWFLLDTVFDGVSSSWGADYVTEFDGTYYVSFNTKFGKLAKVNTDYGNRITRIIDFAFEQDNGEHFGVQSIELGISQGYNAADGSVALQLSRNNVEYGSFMYRDLGAIGEYEKKLVWNYAGGLGNYAGFMGGRIYTTEDVEFNCDFLEVKFR